MPDGYPKLCPRIKLKSLKIKAGLKSKVIVKPEFYVLGYGKVEVVVGAKTMQKLKIVLNPSIKKISFN